MVEKNFFVLLGVLHFSYLITPELQAFEDNPRISSESDRGIEPGQFIDFSTRLSDLKENEALEYSWFADLSRYMAGGVTIDNGGDLVTCDGQAVMSLDFLQSVLLSGANKAFTPQYELDIGTMILQLKKSHYKLADDLEQFLSDALNRKAVPWSVQHLWKGFSAKLVDVPDEDLSFDISSFDNCEQLGEFYPLPLKGKFAIEQAIIRREFENFVQFDYQADLLDGLKKHSDYQFFYFLIHEWLWRYTRSADVNRTFNNLLHSQGFLNLAPESLAQLIDKLGLDAWGARSDSNIPEKIGEFQNMVFSETDCDPFRIHLVPLRSDPSEMRYIFSNLPKAEEICALDIVETTQHPGEFSSIDLAFNKIRSIRDISITSETFSYCSSKACLSPKGVLKEAFLWFQLAGKSQAFDIELRSTTEFSFESGNVYLLMSFGKQK